VQFEKNIRNIIVIYSNTIPSVQIIELVALKKSI